MKHYYNLLSYRYRATARGNAYAGVHAAVAAHSVASPPYRSSIIIADIPDSYRKKKHFAVQRRGRE